jgi:hypothetical protein
VQQILFRGLSNSIARDVSIVNINKILQNGGVRTCPLPTSFGSRRSSALPQGMLMITAL